MSNDKTREAFLAALNNVSDGAYLIPGWDVHSIKQALSASEGAAPVALSVSDSQFLSDVMTAAGLVYGGAQCKALGERLGEAVMRIRTAAPQPAVNGAGLSDAEIQSLWDASCNDTPQAPGWNRHLRFARAILSAYARQAIIAQLPPMPDPGGHCDVDGDWVRHGHTDEAMRAYARDAITSAAPDAQAGDRNG